MTRRIPGRIAGSAMLHLFKKPATIAYPKGQLKMEPNYRGKLVFEPENCIGCKLCMRDCPANAIHIENVGSKENKIFECRLDLGHCIYCGQCADSCRKNCIHLSDKVDLGSLNKADLEKVKL